MPQGGRRAGDVAVGSIGEVAVAFRDQEPDDAGEYLYGVVGDVRVVRDASRTTGIDAWDLPFGGICVASAAI